MESPISKNLCFFWYSVRDFPSFFAGFSLDGFEGCSLALEGLEEVFGEDTGPVEETLDKGVALVALDS